MVEKIKENSNFHQDMQKKQSTNHYAFLGIQGLVLQMQLKIRYSI